MISRSMTKKVPFGIVSIFLLATLVGPGGCKDKERVGESSRAMEAKAPAVTSKPEKAPTARTVQSPIVAGSFYPAGPDELGSMIKGFLDLAPAPEIKGRVFGIMVPHAGYRYSGPVAAYAYKALVPARPSRFVILGPSHRSPLEGVFVLDKDAYRTPLGEVEMDREAAKKLVASRDWIVSDDRFYSQEHSLEVQIPFIQTVAGPGLKINVVMMGGLTDDRAADFAKVLDETFPGDDVVFVASTDMSHGNYPPYKGTEQTKPVDLKTLETIESMDVEAVARGVKDRTRPICGGLPVVTLMRLFKERGGRVVKTLHYADSGDATGDRSRVVGYGAAAFILDEEDKSEAAPGPASDASAPSPKGFHLTGEEKKELLEMARAFAEAAVKRVDLPTMETKSESLRSIGAAFVTLKTEGDLRGCIGTIIPNEPLYLCVQRRAVDAAIHDARFFMHPLTPEDLKKLEIEISVLTPIERCQSPEEVKVGRDGVLITLGRARGVFLPQVPIEQGWDHDAYLSNLCRKAGVMDPNCWKRDDAVLERFQAIVFSESEFDK